MAIDAPGWMVTASLALLCAFASIACVRFGAESERMFGSHDPSSVVADEVAGGALALLVVPWWMLAGSGHASLHAALITGSAGFIGFRIFDVWKPGFVFTLQDYKGGWGILLDDLGAAACTWPVALLASVLTIPVRSTVG
jgi:phosphatidylglycerophosphatase A